MYRAKEEGIDDTAVRTPANVGTTSFWSFCERVIGPALTV